MSKKKKEEVTREFSTLHEAFRLIQDRVETVLPTMADELVDCIILDPAYDSQDEHRQVGTTTRMKDWFDTMPLEAFPGIFEELFRVLKRKAHMYVFCDKDTSDPFKKLALTAGFEFGNELIWDKGVMSTGYNWRGRTERILFFKKGKRARQLKDKTLRGSDLLSFPAIRSDSSYPSEKPVDLMERLILNSTDCGDIVFAPFCGASPDGEAALRHFRQFIGVDVSEDAMQRSFDRLCGVLERMTDFIGRFGLQDEGSGAA